MTWGSFFSPPIVPSPLFEIFYIGFSPFALTGLANSFIHSRQSIRSQSDISKPRARNYHNVSHRNSYFFYFPPLPEPVHAQHLLRPLTNQRLTTHNFRHLHSPTKVAASVNNVAGRHYLVISMIIWKTDEPSCPF